ncbi:hypothetical protein B0T49_21765 [Chromobacterium violaceum]|uniref:hypothetical protein n=1 Tax=Chromobacterium violaceum TaxID=536 RepID=UPI0009DB2EC1|nr:hypothetical protein [Chromobacterium violaceum]OQS44022.1 hypothetical protein B0T48_21875 [Chromobacterium violaceum]OQS45263.1 hypothetical protein B0T49_21765 [Chromobacterium violaceum]
MQFQAQLKIIGAKRFRDTVDGTLYDNTKLFVEVSLNDNNGNAVGSASSEMQWGTSENFAKISALQFPFMAQCQMEMVTNGKTNKTVITDLRPITAAAQKSGA